MRRSRSWISQLFWEVAQPFAIGDTPYRGPMPLVALRHSPPRPPGSTNPGSATAILFTCFTLTSPNRQRYSSALMWRKWQTRAETARNNCFQCWPTVKYGILLIRTVDYLSPSFPLTSAIPFHVIYVPSQNVHCQLTFPGTVGVNGPYNDSSQTVSHCAL